MTPIMMRVPHSFTTALRSRPHNALDRGSGTVFDRSKTVLSLRGAKASKSCSSTSITNWPRAEKHRASAVGAHERACV
jgi:hypothetical protein